MKRHVFIADDNKIPDLEGLRAVASRQGFEEPIPFNDLKSAEMRDHLLEQAASLAQMGNLVYLITDADFAFETAREFGGDRLARQFLEIGGACRAIIRSEEPMQDLSFEKDQRVWAVKRAIPLEHIFDFLASGTRPRTSECLELFRHIAAFRHALDLGIESSNETQNKVLQALAMGFGGGVPKPFAGQTYLFFDPYVAAYMKRRMVKDSEWAAIVAALHPYDALEGAVSAEFAFGKKSGSGFFILWQLSQCGREPLQISTNLDQVECNFLPREREWISQKRRALRIQLNNQFGSTVPNAPWVALFQSARNELLLVERLLDLVDEV